MTKRELCKAAIAACDKAYAPYSDFCVGAAISCKNGKVYTGSNIENSSFGATVCAERVALFSAVHAGEREFLKIAIACKKDGHLQPVSPCGICRQTLMEFCEASMPVLCVESEEEFSEYSMEELLKNAFRLEK